MTHSRHRVSQPVIEGLQYVLARFALLLLQSLPYVVALCVARVLAATACAVHFRHDVVRGNLFLAFGDTVDESKRRRIASGVYRHWVRTLMADSPHLLRTVRRDNWSSFVDATALEPLQQLHAEGRGVILVSGHLGNPEFGGWLGALVGLPIYSVANLQENTRLNGLLEAVRTSSGQRILYKRGALRKGRDVLARGEIVALLADLNDGREGPGIDFFGREAPTTHGPAVLAIRSGAPILPVAVVLDGRGPHYHVAYGEPIRPVPGAPLRAEMQRITQAYTTALERFIRLWPEQWIWFHRRWKESRMMTSPST
jgi:KDO2-lipid IV(A) lauroyltransferase